PEDHPGRRGSLTDAFDSATSPSTHRAPSSELSRGTTMRVASSFEPYVSAKRLSAIKDEQPMPSPYDDRDDSRERIGDASADQHVAEKRYSARMKSVRAVVDG
ncbi:hypothetical protein HDZ31DRAFT_69503, partial [Schizophyllum fasciatum]